MLTTGQMVFGAIFALVFIVVITLMYRRDRGWQRKQYKGVLKVLLAFISFLIILLLLKYFLKN
ncbi:hypothetical protein SAMN04490243_2449 [Robiginitalea myxolifaciens]|uniref:Uncharacterized protein n=1 Tax=Robiginitalea myxolifaciens TaxID=400055 RepID=A0A1I6H9C6_9FLAO|nr:hypothetical protein [Robiginitalea myxolifaciens]SFR51123.1 hypothetical protein SAMN04490243_2449 [Robiginitalea myxolifaciens]